MIPKAGTIIITQTERFTPEIEQLRRAGYLGADSSSGSEDEFDAASVHVTAHIDGRLAGTVRITPEPPSPVAAWSEGKDGLPHGPGCVDLTRAVVAEQFRGLSIYKLLMLKAMRAAREMNADHALGLVKPDFPLLGFLHELGFHKVGPVQIYTNPLGRIPTQPILYSFGQQDTAAHLHEQVLKKVEAKGYSIRFT